MSHEDGVAVSSRPFSVRSVNYKGDLGRNGLDQVSSITRLSFEPCQGPSQWASDGQRHGIYHSLDFVPLLPIPDEIRKHKGKPQSGNKPITPHGTAVY